MQDPYDLIHREGSNDSDGKDEYDSEGNYCDIDGLYGDLGNGGSRSSDESQ